MTYLPLWDNVINHLQGTKLQKHLALLIISSPPSPKISAQISDHSFWPNQLIFTVCRVSTLSEEQQGAENVCWNYQTF